MRVPRREGRCNSAVGAAVWMAKLTCPDTLVFGGAVQVPDVGGSGQEKVIIPGEPLANWTLMGALTVPPCVTWRVDKIGARVKSGEAGAEFHLSTRLLASTDPRPATTLQLVV